jgi:hypothetical protein
LNTVSRSFAATSRAERVAGDASASSSSDPMHASPRSTGVDEQATGDVHDPVPRAAHAADVGLIEDDLVALLAVPVDVVRVVSVVHAGVSRCRKSRPHV